MLLENLLPEQNTSHLEDRADLILLRNNMANHNEINIEKLISNYKNIRLHYMDQDSTTIIRNNKAIIIINNNLCNRKQREELAEEFCHVLLHCGNQLNIIGTVDMDKQENQAKRMSAYLLCPLFILKKLTFVDNTCLLLNELANFFGVTYEFIEYRLSLIFGQDLNSLSYYNGDLYGFISI